MDNLELNLMVHELSDLWQAIKAVYTKLRDEVEESKSRIRCLTSERNLVQEELDKARVKIADLETRPPWEAGRDPHRVRLILENCDLRGVVKRLRQGLSEAQVEAQIPTRGDEYQRLLQAEHQLSRIAANSKIVLLREED